MISIALFTISSLLCGLAPNLTTLVLARVFQGIGGGGLAPVEQSILADTFPPDKRGMAFAAFAIVVVVGPSCVDTPVPRRSEEHTSDLQSLMRTSYAVFCLKNKKTKTRHHI